MQRLWQGGYEDRIAWLRKLIAWQEEMADSGEMLDEVRSQVFDDRVYVFTPKGDVVDLPSGSTPLDFAYHIHCDVGHRCIGAKPQRLCRLPISCRWAIRLKSSPRNSRTQAATG